MPNPLEKLRAFIEKGARNSANDASMIQTMHDHSVSLGAMCAVSEAASFSNSDALTLLNAAVRKQFNDNYSAAWISDVYDDYLVFCADYSSGICYRCDYSVDDTGSVTLGQPIAVVRKVTYIEPNTLTSESDVNEVEFVSDSVALIEDVETNLIEANTRMLKLIAPGQGSSGYYSADVLKRDAGMFKAGTHNYIDHLTAVEEKTKPEGYLDRLASVLTEDARWYDDYNGHGPGLYAKAKVSEKFNTFLNDFGNDIGTSIRANGRVKIGEIDGKKGTIIEAITSVKSVDYVTVAGAGGKVLDLVESAKIDTKSRETQPKESEINPMAENTELQETINRLNAKFTRNEAQQYARGKITVLRVKDAVKERIIAECVKNIPFNSHASTIDPVSLTAFSPFFAFHEILTTELAQ